VMTNAIPSSYLEAGSLLFENDEGTLLVWRFSWGGAAYAGSTTAALTNDDDREFGPPYPDPLPTSGLQAVVFAGAATNTSTSNAADYGIVDPGLLTNNAGESFMLIVANCGDLDAAGEDSDGDGVRDVCDDCPNDESKVEPGECGCGNPDLDANGNGLTDCVEGMDTGDGSSNDNGDNGNSDDNSDGAMNGNDNGMASDDNDSSQGASDDDDSDGGNNQGSAGDHSDGGTESQGGPGSGSASVPRPCSFGVGTIGVLFAGILSLRLHQRQKRFTAIRRSSR